MFKVIHAGEKLRESKKKQKMASSNSTANRDWGKVISCDNVFDRARKGTQFQPCNYVTAFKHVP